MFKRSTVFDKIPRHDDTFVVICVPTNGMVHARFTYCLTKAIQYAQDQGVLVLLEMDEGTVLSNQRQVLSDMAVSEYDADYVMWLDSDMTFPPNIIVRLLEHNADAICATYSKRVPPFHATAFYSIDPVVPVDTAGTGVVSVKYAGMGCMLIKASAIANIPKPHFGLKWHAPSATWHGEDMGFCDVLSNNGVELLCDLDLSREIGHLGQREFRLNQAS